MKIYIAIICLLIIQITIQEDSYFNIPYKNEPKQKNLKQLSREFENISTLFVTFEENLLVDIIQIAQIKTLVFPKKDKIIEKIGKFQAYIIVTNSTENIKLFLESVYQSYISNSRGKYLIYFSGDKSNLEEIFAITWKYFVLNIIVIIEDEMFTHFPYRNKSCGLNLTPEKIISTEFYVDKFDADQNGCEIKLMGLNIKPYVNDIAEPKDDPVKAGLEVTIIHTVLEKMNFTTNYVKNPFTHWGYLLPDGNFTMTFQSLINGEVDMIFGMNIGNETIEEYFDGTVSHIDTAAVWFVPTAQQIAQWKNLTVIFDGIVWLSIFVVFILNGVTWWLMGRKRESGESYNELSLCLMGSFYMLLQGSFTTPQAWKIRFVVLIWSISSLLINTAHQCQLTGILTSPLYEHQISNVKELVESNLDYGFYPILKDLFSDPNNKVHRKIFQNFKPCSLTTECMNRTAFKRDFAVVKNRRQGTFLMPRYYSSPTGKPMLYTFKDSEFLVWCKYYVNRGFPFLEKIDNKILLLQSSGLIEKWEKDLTSGAKGEDETQLEPLNLNHLQGAFFLLFIGYLVSVSMFVSEKIFFGYSKNRRLGVEKNILPIEENSNV